ncbi:MAG: hypothetical protein K0R15_2711 [Clostridiales bacterium]|jgi:hypothetical protein|nr:hypothetical protein [Clostridiales bacterium]
MKRTSKTNFRVIIFVCIVVLFFAILFCGRDLQNMLNLMGVGYNITYPIFNFVQYIGYTVTFIGILLLIFFTIANYYYSRAIQPHAAEILDKDKRKPIFILRPFKSDNKKIFPIHYNKETHFDIESLLVSELVKYGPVVAIGKPKEALQPKGASRLYADDSWKDKVELLVNLSSVVILIIDFTPGVKWEIHKVLKDYREKLIIIPKLHSTLSNNIINLIYAIPLVEIHYTIGKPIKFIFKRYGIFKKLRRGFGYYRTWNKYIATEVDTTIPKINDRVSALIYNQNGYKTFVSENGTNEEQINSILRAIKEKCEESCDDSESGIDEAIRYSIDSLRTERMEYDYNKLSIIKKIKFVFHRTNKQGLKRSLVKWFCVFIIIAGIFTTDYIVHDKVIKVETESYGITIMGEEMEGEYTGQWRHRKPNGEGYFVIKNVIEGLEVDDYLKGYWENGFLKYGVIYHNKTNTVLYRGQFKDGNFSGTGIFVFDDGTYYSGEFKNGAFNGEGAIYDSNNKMLLKGYFKDGEYQN